MQKSYCIYTLQFITQRVWYSLKTRRGLATVLEPLVDSDHIPISGGDVVDIFGGVDAEYNGSDAPETSDPANEAADEPRQHPRLELQLSRDLQHTQ